MPLFRGIFNRVEAVIHSRLAYKFFLKDWIELGDLDLLARVLSTARFTRNIKPLVMDRVEKTRILVVAPHLDDEILGAGGTLIKSIAGGSTVKVLYLTDGSTEKAKQLPLPQGLATK